MVLSNNCLISNYGLSYLFLTIQVLHQNKTEMRITVSELCGRTVPHEGFDSSVIMPFPGVLWLWHFLFSVSPYPVSSLHIYPLLCSGHSCRVRLAKQKTLTPPGHLVSSLFCRDLWMSTVVLYCWCHSDGASVRLYFTFMIW